MLLFVAPLTNLTDGGTIELTVPEHYSQSDKIRTCNPHDYDFDNTQIKATGNGSLTVTTADRIPKTDPSWKAGGYKLVVACSLPAGSSDANDTVDVTITRNGQAAYADRWAQPCKK